MVRSSACCAEPALDGFGPLMSAFESKAAGNWLAICGGHKALQRRFSATGGQSIICQRIPHTMSWMPITNPAGQAPGRGRYCDVGNNALHIINDRLA